MAALTDNIEINEQEGKLVDHPVVASDIIFKGALVKHNAAGYLAPCVAEVGGQFAGVAYEKVDNSAGAAGAVECRAIKSGAFELLAAGMAQADVGSIVYATDDQLVSTTDAGNEQAVGKITKVLSATKILVRIDGYAY